MALELRLSDGIAWERRFTAHGPRSLRAALWQIGLVPRGVSALQLHVRSTAFTAQWYWVEREDRELLMTRGILLARPPYILWPAEAEMLWRSIVRTERVLTAHARAIHGLADWAGEQVADPNKD